MGMTPCIYKRVCFVYKLYYTELRKKNKKMNPLNVHIAYCNIAS